MRDWAIVPVKSLERTKSRLSAVLSPLERATLTQNLLRRTLEKLKMSGLCDVVLVVSRDATVQQISRAAGAHVFAESDGQDLNGSLTEARVFAVANGATRLLILPSDLPYLSIDDLTTMFAEAAESDSVVTISTDSHHTGTNGLRLWSTADFTFEYGEQSFNKHLDQARQRGYNPLVIITQGLQFDLDTIDDWHSFLASPAFWPYHQKNDAL